MTTSTLPPLLAVAAMALGAPIPTGSIDAISIKADASMHADALAIGTDIRKRNEER